LVGYINPALRDATQIGNPSYSKTPGGIAIAGTGSSLLFKSVPSFSNSATILFVGNWLTGGSHSASIGNSGSGDQCFIFQSSTTGISRPRALIRTSAGGGVTTAEAIGSGNDTQYDQIEVWCARYDGTTALKLYRNGKNYTAGNASTAASGSISTLNNIGLGGTNRGSDSFAAAGQLQTLGLYWNRALSDDEILVIGSNPWQLFRPVQRRVYFDMGAGGGATTSVNADLAAEYKIRSTVHADGAGAYAVRAVAASDTSPEYSIRGAISSDVSASYIVRALAQADIPSAYLVRVAVQADAASTFTVRGAAQSDAAGAYDLRKSVGANSEHAFMVRGLVSSDLDASFTVEAPITQVYADLQAAYLVDGGAVFIPSQFVASVPAGVFSARASAGEYSATVPAGIFKASI
jgi:hypothetical protein